MKRSSKTVDYLWDGPFEISEVIGTHAYRVKILTGLGRPPHNVFHISRLRKVEEQEGMKEGRKRYKTNGTHLCAAKTFSNDIHPEDNEYEVEAIIDVRRKRGVLAYLVARKVTITMEMEKKGIENLNDILKTLWNLYISFMR